VQPDNVMFHEGDKFMWDGELYEPHEAAELPLYSSWSQRGHGKAVVA